MTKTEDMADDRAFWLNLDLVDALKRRSVLGRAWNSASTVLASKSSVLFSGLSGDY